MATLTTSVNPLGSGTIVETGSGDNHIITANANSGYNFQNWLVKGYTQLDYIQGDGNSYIDTGFIPNENGNTTSFYIKGRTTTKVNNAQLCNISATYTYGYGIYKGGGAYMEFPADSYSYVWQENMDFEVSATPSTLLVKRSGMDDVSSSGTEYYARQTQTLILFNNHSSIGTADTSANCKMYSCKLWDNNVLVRDFIPIIRHSDGAIGMLDLVHFKFYGNSGTGVFIGGDFI